MYNGIINVYKEAGFTSFDVVAKLRGICGQKKIGHTGTLDPDAEGVLPVCLGNATKVCDMLTDRDKEYRAVMRLGIETDTQDMSGQILATGSLEGISEEKICEVIVGFIGEQMQIPPMYSALKVGGQKLCDLARKGQTVERKARPITIYRIVVEEIALPRVTMTVQCSKGTYIRTLCHDIGEKLGCHGALEHLVRTKAAGYRIEDAVRLSELEERRAQGTLFEVICPVEDVFAKYPGYQTTENADRLLYNGNRLFADQLLILQKDFVCAAGAARKDDSGDKQSPSQEIASDFIDRQELNCEIRQAVGDSIDKESGCEIRQAPGDSIDKESGYEIRQTVGGSIDKESGCEIQQIAAKKMTASIRFFTEIEAPKNWVRIYDSHGRFCAIYMYKNERECFCPVKMFL